MKQTLRWYLVAVTPDVRDSYEDDATNDVGHIAENMPKVFQAKRRHLAEKVVVTKVKVPIYCRFALILNDQLKYRQRIEYSHQNDDP